MWHNNFLFFFLFLFFMSIYPRPTGWSKPPIARSVHNLTASYLFPSYWRQQGYQLLLLHRKNFVITPLWCAQPDSYSVVLWKQLCRESTYASKLSTNRLMPQLPAWFKEKLRKRKEPEKRNKQKEEMPRSLRYWMKIKFKKASEGKGLHRVVRDNQIRKIFPLLFLQSLFILSAITKETCNDLITPVLFSGGPTKKNFLNCWG